MLTVLLNKLRSRKVLCTCPRCVMERQVIKKVSVEMFADEAYNHALGHAFNAAVADNYSVSKLNEAALMYKDDPEMTDHINELRYKYGVPRPTEEKTHEQTKAE